MKKITLYFLFKTLLMGCLVIFCFGCERTSDQIIESNSIQLADLYYSKIQKIPDIKKEDQQHFLYETSKEFLNKLSISDSDRSGYLRMSPGALINEAAKMYFEITNKGENYIRTSRNSQKYTTLSSNYQPKFTVVNMSSCPVNYTVFIKTQIGDCNHIGTSYYVIDSLLHAPVGTTSYINGFASFGNHIWHPTNETTQDLINQDLTAYYYGVKYEVGTDCSNISIGFCGAAQGESHTQQCGGCSGGNSFYTVSLIADMSEDMNLYSNPDSPFEMDQDITLFIIAN